MSTTYLKLMADVMRNGVADKSRAGRVRRVFGRQIRFSLRKRFPLLTTKSVHFHSVVHELLWFLRGDTNVAYLQANNVRIWNEWADENGDLGPIYGKQWRSWETADGKVIDQIETVVDVLRVDPTNRRLVVTAWNPGDIDAMALAPCHCLFQFAAINGRLHCHLYQRSADIFLGVPFNIASYALLTCMIAHVTGLQRGSLVHTFGDLHLYENHVPHALLQMRRTPRHSPALWLDPNVSDIDGFSESSFALNGYNPHPVIKADVNV